MPDPEWVDPSLELDEALVVVACVGNLMGDIIEMFAMHAALQSVDAPDQLQHSEVEGE